MRNPAVHWYEGLFLRPQHFQAADRYWQEFLCTSQQWDHPFHYGLYEIAFSKEAIGNHQFEVHALKARMRDGTLVSLETGQTPDRIDLKEALGGGPKKKLTAELAEAFERAEVVRVYLAIPKLRLGRPNVTSGSGSDARYQETVLPVQDESRGGDDRELQFRTLNARLLLSTQDVSGYELLPIAQVKRASEGAAAPQLDKDYIPPLLAIDVWPALGREIVRAIYDVIGQKLEVLSQQLLGRGIGLDSQEPGDADRIEMLSQLNGAYSLLSVLAFTPGIHPLTVYVELCRIAGQLAIFSPERRAAGFSPYDHEDLAGIFKQIQIRVEQCLNSVRDYEYQQRYFVGLGLEMQVTLEPRWFNSDWQWYVGVRKGDLTTQEVRELLSPGQLDWKLGSSRQVEMLFQHRAPGLQLTPMERTVRALPARQDWIYYEVPRTDTPAWRDVQQTQTLALRLKDSLIVNYDRLQGETQLVVSTRGKRVPLQFALFAVPVTT
ncbi:MAG: type VI secretion system baseplate subunit TssK [Planctomycetota bacterium]|nr:type VI secretion system baseplate subunit TssK [Planctomycetota bacterium]